MKKILLASTALVGFAGMAAAEVTVSGSAEMGIVGGSGQETRFFQDIDVTFKMSGETDNGLTFGAAVDLDEAQDNCTAAAGAAVNCVNAALDNTDDDGGVAIFVSGDFGTVTLGDTDGAMDWALQEANIGNPGSINDAETGHAGFFGSYHDGQYDGQILRYDNTFGDFGVALSFEMDHTGARDTGYALGVKYSTDLGGTTVNFGLGYQTVDLVAGAGGDAEIIGLTVSATMDNGFSGQLGYVSGDILGTADSNHLSLGVGYTTGALSIHANYGKYDFGNNTEADGFGLAVGYDMGGGLKVLAGYGSGTARGAAASTDSFSLGLSMSF